MEIYTVQKGDTLESIAEKYNIPELRLAADNNLSPNYALNIGQAIMIAPPTQTYIIEDGDTLDSIAASHGITVIDLLRNNPQLSDQRTLEVGDELIISYNTAKRLQVIGYTTTFITERVLRKTLPYLTYINILNYRVDGLGSIQEINDEQIIDLAKQYGVAPIMFVSAMSETGRGSYATTHAILNNREIQDKLIENILLEMMLKGYSALNLAFYSILMEDLNLYIDFVSRVTERMNREGYEVFVTLTPHTLGYKAGTKYEASYYADFGAVANYVILLTYLFQQGTVSQMSETTVNFLNEILDFVVTQIPPEKIFIGLARTAYDWELPYVEGESIGVMLTNAGAISLANQLGSVIEFDEVTQTPYYNYNSSGISHFVWFKDARSYIAILKLVDQYGLAGVAVWNIINYNTPAWLTINSNYNVVSYEDKYPPQEDAQQY